MKITEKEYRKAYECGIHVYEKTMRLKDAKASLKNTTINPNSATDLIYNVGHMLSGRRYIRTLNADNTENYLLWIERDFGKSGLKKAVSALKQHIQYYQSMSGSPMKRHVEILDSYSHLLEEEPDFIIQPEEESGAQNYLEGQVRSVKVNIHERNRTARSQCIEAYGCFCAVCHFDFASNYGRLGEGFIHVHHLKELSQIGQEYVVNPIKDLRPVCPNCHAMLHQTIPPISINDLKKMIQTQKKSLDDKSVIL